MGLSEDLQTPPRWSIIIDLRLTRRKFYHCIVNPAGQMTFKSRHLGECIDWLAAEGVSAVDLLHAEHRSKDAHLAATLTVET
jgi:hypothetical protein